MNIYIILPLLILEATISILYYTFYTMHIIYIIAYIAVDWITLKIYLAYYNEGFIEVYDLVTSHHKRLITLESGVRPRQVIVDPTTRYVYYLARAYSCRYQ